MAIPILEHKDQDIVFTDPNEQFRLYDLEVYFFSPNLGFEVKGGIRIRFETDAADGDKMLHEVPIYNYLCIINEQTSDNTNPSIIQGRDTDRSSRYSKYFTFNDVKKLPFIKNKVYKLTVPIKIYAPITNLNLIDKVRCEISYSPDYNAYRRNDWVIEKRFKLNIQKTFDFIDTDPELIQILNGSDTCYLDNQSGEINTYIDFKLNNILGNQYTGNTLFKRNTFNGDTDGLINDGIAVIQSSSINYENKPVFRFPIKIKVPPNNPNYFKTVQGNLRIIYYDDKLIAALSGTIANPPPNTFSVINFPFNYKIRYRTSQGNFIKLVLPDNGSFDAVFNEYNVYMDKQIKIKIGNIDDINNQGYTEGGILILTKVTDEKNLISLENQLTTQQYSFSLDEEPEVNFNLKIANPSIVNFNQPTIFNYTIKYFNNTTTPPQEIFDNGTFTINIKTTYPLPNTVNLNTNPVIGVLDLKQYAVTSSFENSVYIPTINYEQNISIQSNQNITFKTSNETQQNYKLQLGLTGIKKATIKFEIEQPNIYNSSELVTFEDGTNDYTYELDSDDLINNFEVSMIIQNPLKEQYNKPFQLLISIFDGIDTFAKPYVFNIITTYPLNDYYTLISNLIENLSIKSSKSLQSIEDTLNNFSNSLDSFSEDIFTNINENIQNINTTELKTSIDETITPLFTDLNNTIERSNFFKVDKFETNVNYISPYDIRLELYNINDGSTIIISNDKITFTDNVIGINQNINKGRYILKLEQIGGFVLNTNIVSSTQFNTYSLIESSIILDKNYSGYKIKYNNNWYHIILNDNKFLLLYPQLTDSNVQIQLYKNIFDTMFYELVINNYDINDVGDVLLNKKETNIKDKNEKIYNDDDTLKYHIIYETNNDIQTRKRVK